MPAQLPDHRRQRPDFEQWYRARCVTSERHSWAWANDLFADFHFFMGERLCAPMSLKEFGAHLARKGHRTHKSNGRIQRIGIRLRNAGERAQSERSGDGRLLVALALGALIAGRRAR